MNVTWYMKKTICRNGVEERTKYAVRSDCTKGVRAQREARKEARRNDNAERQSARLLNNNFDAGKDVHLVLEYTDAELGRLRRNAEKSEAASCAGTGADARANDIRDALFIEGQKDLRLFVRRVQRECKKQGITLRYYGATSDMDGETGAPARLHQHFVVNAEAAEICAKKWRGCVWDSELYNVNGDLSALASYIIRQVRAVPGTQRYVPSRNLVPPETTEPMPLVGNAAKYAENEMRLPKGCTLLYRSTYVRGATQYIRFKRQRRE